MRADGSPDAGEDLRRVRDLSEAELLGSFLPLLPEGSLTQVGPGDDCAVIGAPDSRYVMTTDVLVDGQHFRREWSTPRQIGARAVYQNLADVAAMGARPAAILAGIGLPPDLPASWLTECARGMCEACGSEIGIVGGDLVSSPILTMSLTATGDLQGRAPVLRSGARPGQILAVAGYLGFSAAGLALMREGLAAAPECVKRFLVPVIDPAVGIEAAICGASAMMDVSDGLVMDLRRLCLASGVDAELNSAALVPRLDALADAAAAVGVSARDWVLFGGEDHAFLAVFPDDSSIPEGFVEVGRVMESFGSGGRIFLDDESIDGVGGWDPFGS